MVVPSAASRARVRSWQDGPAAPWTLTVVSPVGPIVTRIVGVVIGARVAAKAQADDVLVSRTVKDVATGSGFVFEDAGEHELKGIPDRWQLYRVVGGPGDASGPGSDPRG